MNAQHNPGQDVSGLLQAWGRGHVEARDQLLPLVYQELRRRAAAYLRRERLGHTLQPTALVHEAYLRLVKQDRISKRPDTCSASRWRPWNENGRRRAWLYIRLTGTGHHDA
jgi:hypothetical protein